MAEEGATSKFEVTQAKTPDDSTLSPMSPTSYTLSDNDRTTDRLLPDSIMWHSFKKLKHAICLMSLRFRKPYLT
ncbi:hypothetical protein NPIL_443861 [Nephila pilipes]|uniref:Uncharacterized protein n=1 Tax=Nephila pilipes TaxID=299642 RepID=A0A8X6T7E2_NEPPI|nr:hypothetical protein NPIL_443861 [Nephila pilipes]